MGGRLQGSSVLTVLWFQESQDLLQRPVVEATSLMSVKCWQWDPIWGGWASKEKADIRIEKTVIIRAQQQSNPQVTRRSRRRRHHDKVPWGSRMEVISEVPEILVLLETKVRLPQWTQEEWTMQPSQYEVRCKMRCNKGGPRANVPPRESTGRIRGRGSEVTSTTSHTLRAGNWRIKEERKSSDLKAAHSIWWNFSHLHWFKAFSPLLVVYILRQVPTFSWKSMFLLLAWCF